MGTVLMLMDPTFYFDANTDTGPGPGPGLGPGLGPGPGPTLKLDQVNN
jgi:hypothetical protein